MPAAVGRGAGSRSVKSQRRDRHFINTLLGEGEVSVRIQQLTTVKVKYRRRSSADYGGCETSRRKVAGGQTGGWLRAAGLWQAATQNLLPTDSLLPPPMMA